MVNTELLSDLIKLVKKYGIDSFQELVYEINKPNFIENVSSILKVAPKLDIEKPTKTNRKKKPTNEYPKSLETLNKTDKEKFDFLYQLYEKLLSKQSLVTLREINFFREDIGLAPSSVKSHKDGIKSLINDLANFPIERLQKLEIETVSDKNGLEGWSNIILKKSTDNAS